jgi:hypothetical protein
MNSLSDREHRSLWSFFLLRFPDYPALSKFGEADHSLVRNSSFHDYSFDNIRMSLWYQQFNIFFLVNSLMIASSRNKIDRFLSRYRKTCSPYFRTNCQFWSNCWNVSSNHSRVSLWRIAPHDSSGGHFWFIFQHAKQWYRLINKYMPQPGLIKMRRTFTDKTCLSSDIVSITFIYFLNSLFPSLKYLIQFFLIDTPQNRL